MSKRRIAYLVAFVVILGAIFLAEVRLPGNLPFGGGAWNGRWPPTPTSPASSSSCTSGWNVTGYFTPVETDYTGPAQTVTVNGTARSFYSSFLEDVQVEGWGQTKEGNYIGYENGQYSASQAPLNSLGGSLRIGDVAVDFSVIQAGTILTIPTLPSPWNTTRFTADDSGVGIVGKHVDVYTGLGATAKQETFRFVGDNQFVCQLVVRGAAAFAIAPMTTPEPPGLDLPRFRETSPLQFRS